MTMPRLLTPLMLVLIALMAIPRIAAAGDRFRAELSGAEEVPPVDTNATGEFRIKFNDEETAAEFRLTVNDGVRVQQAHIHCGEVGVNGPIIIFLAGLHLPGWDVDGRWVSNTTVTNENIVNTSCGSTLAEIAQSMRDGRTYANVHTKAHPGGEIRGQIVPRKERESR